MSMKYSWGSNILYQMNMHGKIYEKFYLFIWYNISGSTFVNKNIRFKTHLFTKYIFTQVTQLKRINFTVQKARNLKLENRKEEMLLFV